MDISRRVSRQLPQALARCRQHSRITFANTTRTRYHSTQPPSAQLKEKNQKVDQPDLNIKDLLSRNYIYHDILTPAPTKLLSAALNDYITHQNSELPHTRGEPVGGSAQDNWIHLGHHQAYFRPLLNKTMMLDDGTDVKFLPGPADIWKYRLWAGGSVTLLDDKPWDAGVPSEVIQLERAIDARVIGGGSSGDSADKPGKVFVKVEKLLAKVPNQKSGSSTKVRELIDNPRSASYRETHTLCFMRDLPAAFSSSSSQTKPEKRIKPPSNPTFQHTFTPTSSLLFHFSAIMHNAHAIHIDREYTKREYGLRDLLVHGPLTLVMMVDFVRMALSKLAKDGRDGGGDSGGRVVIPRHIEYTNYKPLYVDEEITICCRPNHTNTAGSTTAVHVGDDDYESWAVWIQTGVGEQASLAVKGMVRVMSVVV